MAWLIEQFVGLLEKAIRTWAQLTGQETETLHLSQLALLMTKKMNRKCKINLTFRVKGSIVMVNTSSITNPIYELRNVIN